MNGSTSRRILGSAVGVAVALPAVVLMSGASEAIVASDVAFSCTYSSFTFDYTGDVTVAAAWNTETSRVDLSASFESMTNPAPKLFVNYPGSSITTTADLTANGAAVSLSGTAPIDFVGGTQMTLPTTTGSIDSVASTLTTGITKLTSVVTYSGNQTATFACTPKASGTVAVAVTGRPVVTPSTTATPKPSTTATPKPTPTKSAACRSAEAKASAANAQVTKVAKALQRLKKKKAAKAKVKQAQRKLTAAKQKRTSAKAAALRACR